MKADPKRMQLANGCRLDCVGGRRNQTVPIRMARPRYIPKRKPYTKTSLRLLIQERSSRVHVVLRILLPSPPWVTRSSTSVRDDRFAGIEFAAALGDDFQASWIFSI